MKAAWGECIINNFHCPVSLPTYHLPLPTSMSMIEITRTDSVASETAVLVGVMLPDHYAEKQPLEELAGLAEAAGVRVAGHLTQRREAPDAATYLGSGKVEELSMIVRARDADVVIFDNDLSPGQTRNLEKSLEVKVLDRTELILDIFASRAQTAQARLSVEFAQLEYSMPRLKRLWTHLSRQKEGRRHCAAPAKRSWKKTAASSRTASRTSSGNCMSIERRKEREVSGRREQLTVSLVGYTNAGKSTLLNALTGADVLCRGFALRHARHPHPPLAIARLGTGAAERHGRVHPQLAAPFDREFQGHARRSAAGPSALACGRRRQSGGLRPDFRHVQGVGRNRHSAEGYAASDQQDRFAARPFSVWTG